VRLCDIPRPRRNPRTSALPGSPLPHRERARISYLLPLRSGLGPRVRHLADRSRMSTHRSLVASALCRASSPRQCGTCLAMLNALICFSPSRRGDQAHAVVEPRSVEPACAHGSRRTLPALGAAFTTQNFEEAIGPRPGTRPPIYLDGLDPSHELYLSASATVIVCRVGRG